MRTAVRQLVLPMTAHLRRLWWRNRQRPQQQRRALVRFALLQELHGTIYSKQKRSSRFDPFILIAVKRSEKFWWKPIQLLASVASNFRHAKWLAIVNWHYFFFKKSKCIDEPMCECRSAAQIMCEAAGNEWIVTSTISPVWTSSLFVCLLILLWQMSMQRRKRLDCKCQPALPGVCQTTNSIMYI